MSEKPTTRKATGSLDTRYLKLDGITMLVPLQADVAEMIGRVIVQWGAFESRMDSTIKAMAANLLHTPPSRWERLPFKKRKELFRDLSLIYFARSGDWENVRIFAALCGTAASLQWRRNVVAHGVYRPSTNNKSGLLTYKAYGRHKGKDVWLELDMVTLSKLHQDIAHMNGLFVSRLAKFGAYTNAPELIFEDKEILLGPEQGEFQMLPIPYKP